MKKIFLILLLSFSVLYPQRITVKRSNKQVLTFRISGNYTSKKLEFAVKETMDNSSSILILKKNSLNGGADSLLSASYSNGITTILTTLYPEDTQDLESKAYFYDITMVGSERTTILAPNILFVQGDVNNPLSNTNLPQDGNRYIVGNPNDFTVGQYLQVDTLSGKKQFKSKDLNLTYPNYSKLTDSLDNIRASQATEINNRIASDNTLQNNINSLNTLKASKIELTDSLDNIRASHAIEISSRIANDAILQNNIDVIDSRKVEKTDLVDSLKNTIYIAASNSLNKNKAFYICTGNNDETVINNAINSISGRGVVYFLPGTYTVSARIYKKNLVSLIGYGAILKVKSGLNANVKCVIECQSGSHEHTLIAGFEIDGNESNNRAYSFNAWAQGIACDERDQSINNVSGFIGFADNLIIKDCYIHDTCRSGITIEGTGNVIQNLHVKNSQTDHLVYVVGAKNCVIENLTLEGFVGNSQEVMPVAYTTLADGTTVVKSENNIIRNVNIRNIAQNPVTSFTYRYPKWLFRFRSDVNNNLVDGLNISYPSSSSNTTQPIEWSLYNKGNKILNLNYDGDLTSLGIANIPVNNYGKLSGKITIQSSLNGNNPIIVMGGTNDFDLSGLAVDCYYNNAKELIKFVGSSNGTNLNMQDIVYNNTSGRLFNIEDGATVTQSLNADNISFKGDQIFKGGDNNIKIKLNAKVATFLDLKADNTTYLHASEAGTGSEHIVSISTNPDYPRNVSITTSNISNPSGKVVVSGYDVNNNYTNDTLTISPGSTVFGNIPFSQVVKYVMPSTVTSSDNVSLGIGHSLGLAGVLSNNNEIFKVIKNGSDYSAAPHFESNSVDVGVISANDDFTIYYGTFLNNPLTLSQTYKNNIVNNSTVNFNITGLSKTSGDETSTISWNYLNPISGKGDLKVTVTSAGTNSGRPRVDATTTGWTTGKTYKVKYSIKAISGTVVYNGLSATKGYTSNPTTLTNGVTYNYEYSETATGNGSTISFYFDGRNIFEAEIDNIEIYEHR